MPAVDILRCCRVIEDHLFHKHFDNIAPAGKAALCTRTSFLPLIYVRLEQRSDRLLMFNRCPGWPRRKVECGAAETPRKNLLSMRGLNEGVLHG